MLIGLVAKYAVNPLSSDVSSLPSFVGFAGSSSEIVGKRWTAGNIADAIELLATGTW